MVAVNRVYAARLAGMLVLGPDGESIGRVRDVVISISIVRQQPRVLGLVVELLTRRRIFVPITRVTAIEPNAVTLNTANVSLRRFAQRPGEVLVLGQVIETHVRVDDPELPQLAGTDVVVVDLGIEQARAVCAATTSTSSTGSTCRGSPRRGWLCRGRAWPSCSTSSRTSDRSRWPRRSANYR
jgi:Mg/Co/Ni transporter MgtE